MKKLIFLLLVFVACEKQPIEIVQENYLIGSWKQMDRYGFEWIYSDDKFERTLIDVYGNIAQTLTGIYEYKNDTLYMIATMQNMRVLCPGVYMNYYVKELNKESMIWYVGHEIKLRKLY